MSPLQRIAAMEAILVLIAAVVCGCAGDDQLRTLDGSAPRRAMLEARAATSQGSVMSMFSLSHAGPVSEPEQAELCVYFDRNDCAGGAIIGHRDEKGWLFPIGNQNWQDLQRDAIPPADRKSTAGITPITKAQEGLAFWVRTTSDQYAIVRIARVEPATYDEVAGGKTAIVEFEWMWK